MIGWLKQKVSDLVFGGIYTVIEWAIENINLPEVIPRTATREDMEGILKADLSDGPLTQEGRAMIAKPQPRPEPKAKPPLKGGLEERLAKHQLK